MVMVAWQDQQSLQRCLCEPCFFRQVTLAVLLAALFCRKILCCLPHSEAARCYRG